MQEPTAIIAAHPILAITAAWLAANVLIVVALLRRGSIRERSMLHLIGDQHKQIAEHDHKGEAIYERHRGEVASVRRELSGYRNAVKDLTAHPTTVIIDPYRTAATLGEEAPI